MKQHKEVVPNKWAIKFLRLICHHDFKEEIEGDFLEKYHLDFHKYGLRVARKKMCLQLLSIIKPNLIFNLNPIKMKRILNIKENPQGLLLFTTIALLFALALRPIANTDFQDKTMFSVSLNSMIWIIPLLLMSFWMFYLLTQRFLYSMTITWIHILITVITTLLIVIVLYFGINPSPYVSERHEMVGNAMQLLSMLFVSAQLLYLVNVILGLFAKRKAKPYQEE